MPRDPLTILGILNTQEIYDTYNVVYNGIVPTLDKMSIKMVEDLSKTLDEGANVMIRFFIGGIILAILMLSFSGIFYYNRVVSERRYLCKTLLMIPV